MPTTSGRSYVHRLQLPDLLRGRPDAAQGGPFDQSQSQFIDVKTYSEELRFTVQHGERLLLDRRRLLRAHRALHLHRQHGRPRRRRATRSTRRRSSIRAIRTQPIPTPPSWRTARTTTPGRCSPMPPTSSPSSGSSTPRSATTRTARRTPPTRRTQFLPAATLGTASPARCARQTLDRLQPKGTLRFKPTDNLTLYGGWSRGFRSGGFNQTGVGAVAAADRPRWACMTCSRPRSPTPGRWASRASSWTGG